MVQPGHRRSFIYTGTNMEVLRHLIANTKPFGLCLSFLLLSGCGQHPKAMQLCRELEDASVITACEDTTSSVCKYAIQRASFFLPGDREKSGGAVYIFDSAAQYDRMHHILRADKNWKVLEAKQAGVFVHLRGDAKEDAIQRTQAILDKLPAVNLPQSGSDDTCKK